MFGRAMTRLGLMVAILGMPAWADYPPPAVNCTVPAECTTCGPHWDAGCSATALDAGLILSECFDFTGSSSNPSSVTRYYCPPGVDAHRIQCGCGSAGAAAMVMLLVMAPLLRGRRSRGGDRS